MAQFVRGRKAGVGLDMSAGLVPELFALDHVALYGINSQASAIAYDPVQSLLAIGTNDSRFGPGKVYVFGQKRFCADKIVCVDSKNDITFFSLNHKRITATYSPPARIQAICTDPLLDYAFVGLQNGEVIAYDMDRESPAPFNIPNLWREINPQARFVSVVSLALHPRDVGTLLIGYSDGAAIYSFKQGKAIRSLVYELPVGALGGFSDPSLAKKVRFPKLVQATWHPTGTFILTGHDDESLVFWDPKTAKIVQARTLQDTDVDKPGTKPGSLGSTPGTFALKAPLTRLAWCCKNDPDDTGILVAGGAPTNVPERGLTFFELGRTPVYQTSSWQILSDHLAKPQRQLTLPTPPHIDVVNFCLVPKSSPHFAGCQDPIAIIAILSSGEITTLSFPSGHTISPTNQLHPSLTFVHPFINRFALASVDRTRWLGMVEKRGMGPTLLRGGAEGGRQSMRFESRNVIQAAHADGTVRVWDAGHGDQIENADMLQADVGRALDRSQAVDVSQISMSGTTGEMAVGMMSGEIVVFRYDRNKNAGKEMPTPISEKFGLANVQNRVDPALREGLLPFTMFEKIQAPVTALRMSDIGFCAAGFENGSLVVIDLRGPAVIYEANLTEFSSTLNKRASIRRRPGSSSQNVLKAEWITVIEFGVLRMDGEDYSSISLFVGTNTGRFITFKLLPEPHGGYAVQLAGTTNLEDAVIAICPLDADSGSSALASQPAMSGLRNGIKINGVVLTVTKTGARIFKPPAAKGASKTWSEYFCDSAEVVRSEDRAALVGLFGDGCARTFSLPGLKELAECRIDKFLETQRFSDAIINPTGSIFGWTGPSEIAVVNPWGGGIDLTDSHDMLLNPNVTIPSRPTISNAQWLSGTQHITPLDLDTLIGGPDRPPSKRMIEQMQAEEKQRREAEKLGVATSSGGKQDEGYLAYMQRQMTERTERLNIMGDSMDRLEETSSGWANDVNKFISDQKKKAVMGMIGSKFGF